MTEMTQLYQLYRDSSGICTDTRTLEADQLFFALRGPNFDANRFAQQALDAGAKAAVVDDPELSGPGMFYVPDALTALQHLALRRRADFHIPVLGITGSNGKTSTKELIHRVLSTEKHCFSTRGNLNNHIGIPLTILSWPDDLDIAVVEMGANQQGDIASYCLYARPTCGLITNIGKAHLEGFGGPDGVLRGKTELFRYLMPSSGQLFVPSSQSSLDWLSQGLPRTTYGSKGHEDISASMTQSEPFLSFDWEDKDLQTQINGTYNTDNILAALAVGIHFGISESAILQAIAQYAPDNMRSEIREMDGRTWIVDAYNANPSSVKSALDNLANWSGRPRVALLGEMKELGAFSQAEHLAIARHAAHLNLDQIHLVGAGFEPASEELGLPHYSDAAALSAALQQGPLPEQAVILLKGSRSVGMEQILKSLG